MNITGIEVIRGNPGVAIGVVAGEKLSVVVGDTVRVHMTVDYRGNAIDGTVWTAIGWQTGIIIPEFIEVFHNPTPVPVHFDRSEDFVTYPIVCDVPITDIYGFLIEFALYGNVLDMYAKIMGVPGPDIFTDVYMGAIEVVEVAPPPEYELLEETIYPYSYVYDGDVEVSTFTFKTDPFTPASWVAGKLADHFENEVRNAGGRVMEMRVYVDRSPLLWADWRIEVAGIPPQAQVAAMPFGIVWWAAILIAAFAIIAVIIVATLATKTIVGLFNRKPGLDEVKVGWGKDTLIQTIQDSEEYWERPPTPPETLEGMSEEELRHYLNKIAEEEVAPVISPWAGLAIAGVLGIVVVGAAFALGARPK
ncbi:hypothetical protein ES703_89777 [subsurface metagenome]